MGVALLLMLVEDRVDEDVGENVELVDRLEDNVDTIVDDLEVELSTTGTAWSQILKGG